MKGIIYWQPAFYELSMRIVLGRSHRERLLRIAELVPEGAQVTEFCAGTFALARLLLEQKNARYVGFDLNELFVRRARRRGIDARCHNLAEDDIPSSDIVILQESLYQFIPNERRILEKILSSSRQFAIVAERVGGLSHSRHGIIARLAQLTTDPGTGRVHERFDLPRLQALFAEYPDRLERVSVTPDNREVIGVFSGRAPRT